MSFFSVFTEEQREKQLESLRNRARERRRNSREGQFEARRFSGKLPFSCLVPTAELITTKTLKSLFKPEVKRVIKKLGIESDSLSHMTLKIVKWLPISSWNISSNFPSLNDPHALLAVEKDTQGELS